MSRTPDFIIVGAAKSGTTSLCKYLEEHPLITIVSDRLEYFGEYENPAVGQVRTEEYMSHFKGVPSDICVGEKSVSYLYSRKAVDEIFALNSSAKIIIILRSPAERAYSDYWHRKRTGVEGLAFEEALNEEEFRIKNKYRFELHYANYGLYFGHVSAYMNKFGRENVLILMYSDLKDNADKVCEDCFDFLGVTDYVLEKNHYIIHNKGSVGQEGLLLDVLKWMSRKHKVVQLVRFFLPIGLINLVTKWMLEKNETDRYPEMSVETRERLGKFFYNDIKMLEELIKRDLSSWYH